MTSNVPDSPSVSLPNTVAKKCQGILWVISLDQPESLALPSVDNYGHSDETQSELT